MTQKRLSATLGLVLMIAPAALSAQAACTIELGKPGQIKDANNALAKAALFQGKPDQVTAAVKDAFAKLQKDEAKVIAQNPTGRAMVIGSAFVELASLPNGTEPVTRASIGLAGDGTIDLVAGADSMFDMVEATNAACKDQTEEYRRKVYAALVNQAVNAYNNQQVDSALALANRSLVVYDGYKLAYIAYNIQGNARQSKDDMNGAIESFTKMTDLMKGDTALVDERKSTMNNLAQVILGHAEALEGDAKKAKVAQAVAFLEGYLKEFPGDAKAEATLARAQIMSGDESAAARVFGAMAANPEKYTDTQLFEAGVNAARAEKSKEAAALFEAGLKKNPYSRDALFNIALTLQRLDRNSEADGYLRRLIDVDPENPEAYQVMALNYQTTAKANKTQIDSLRKAALDAANDKKSTMAQKNATAASIKARLDPKEADFKAANDSLLKYFTRYQNAKAKVTFNLWSHDGTKHVLAGNVDNLSEAAQDYVVKFDFIDASGTVIASKEASIAGIAAKGSKAFRLEVDGAGIIAFKYAPFSGS
ncbi:MAG: tetratricopeptide repeat protein [Gemmatimonadaceae bacterium]